MILKKKDSTIKYLKLGLLYARAGDNITVFVRALRLYGAIMSEYNLPNEAAPVFKEAIDVQKY